MNPEQEVQNTVETDSVEHDAAALEKQEATESASVGEDGEEVHQQEEQKFDPKAIKNLERQARDQLKRINKITASNYQYREEIAALKAQISKYQSEGQQKAFNDSKPDVSQYKTIQEYTEALAEWKFKELTGAAGQPQVGNGLSAEDRDWAANAERSLSAQSLELRGAIPDYAQFVDENVELFQQLPFAAQKTILSSSEHPLLALYALAKEGEIGRIFEAQNTEQLAQIMKVATDFAVKNVRSWVDPKLLQPQGKPAPKPITTARGNATAKSEDDLSGKELLNKYRKR